MHYIRAGKISTSRAFDVLSFLAYETDYYVWAGAISQLDWIRRRLEHLPGPHTLFTVRHLIILTEVYKGLILIFFVCCFLKATFALNLNFYFNTKNAYYLEY